MPTKNSNWVFGINPIQKKYMFFFALLPVFYIWVFFNLPKKNYTVGVDDNGLIFYTRLPRRLQFEVEKHFNQKSLESFEFQGMHIEFVPETH
jgi:hypothetical protein